MVFETKIQRVSYVIRFESADEIYSSPAPKNAEVAEKIKSIVWEKIVSPKGPSYHGPKAKKWK